MTIKRDARFAVSKKHNSFSQDNLFLKTASADEGRLEVKKKGKRLTMEKNEDFLKDFFCKKKELCRLKEC